MKPPVDVVLVIGSSSAADIPGSVERALRQQGVAFHLVAEAMGVDALRAWLGEDAPPAAVLLMEDLEDPLATARQVHRLAPLVQIVFLAGAERAASLWREVTGALRVGNHFTILDTDQANVPRLVHDALRVTRQRFKLSTTIDRINLRRQQPPPATDSIAYRKLVVSDRYLASVLEHAGDAILALDRQGRITTWNHGAVKLFGHDELAALERSVDILVADGRRSELLALVRAARTGQAATRDDLVCVRADGSHFDAAVTAAPMQNEEGNIDAVVLIARDVTQQKRAEADLVAANAQLKEALDSLAAGRQELLELNASLEARVAERSRQVRQLASEIPLAEARERGRIARLLHDDLQQQLHVLQVQLHELHDLARGASPEDFEAGYREALETVRVGAAITRNLTSELSPVVHQNEDLADALRWLGERFLDQHGLQVHVVGPEAFPFPHQTLRALLFSLVRELLFNVVKHAGVDCAEVRLRYADDRVEIEVADEGCGFEPESIELSSDANTGLGLTSAAQRLQLFDGSLRIDSHRGGPGTRITVSLPLWPRAFGGVSGGDR